MTRNKLILSIAVVSCLLISLRVHSQESGGYSGVSARESRQQLFEAETDMKMHELEYKMTELAVDEAKVEFEKIKLNLEAAQDPDPGDSRDVEHIKLELKQAAIRIEMRRVQSELARLQIDRARAGLEHIRAALKEKPGKPSRVQVEYIDDLDIVVIRGAKANVERITALIEGAENEKQEKE